MRQLITFTCLLLSAALYYAGLESEAALVFILGMLCELVFWKRLLSRRQR